jgi:adenine specific DNA methylase Mod
VLIDEIFGEENFKNIITWKRSDAHSHTAKKYDVTSDYILFYSKTDTPIWSAAYTPLPQTTIDNWYKNVEEGTGRRFNLADLTNPAVRKNLVYEFLGVHAPSKGWKYSKERMQELFDEGKIVKSGNTLKQKRYLDESKGVLRSDIWTDISHVRGFNKGGENQNYPTQKPEKLVQEIINTSSKEGDIVCDFFVGSGTTAAVAEKLGRKWICSDLGKFSIHTARKRLIGVQRELKKEGKNYRAFEVLNLGKYEREFFVSGLSELDEKAEQQIDNNRELAFNSLILQAYQAEPVSGFRTFRGKKSNRVIAIGPVNMPVSRLFAEQIVA